MLRTRLAFTVTFAATLLVGVAATAHAQRADGVRAGVAAPVMAPLAAALVAEQDGQAAPHGLMLHESAAPGMAQQDTVEGPPISPRRAFLYSFVLPGAGQARLDRAYAGGMFFLVEVAALTLLARSAEDLRIARSFSGDSMPLRYDTDPVSGIVARDTDGDPIVLEWTQPRYNDDFVRTRKLHVEDWLAVLFFNHLFAGADAFVAAQLWDLPAKLGASQSRDGTLITATIPFR
ncbi:MAG TPA: hypothetical protein VFM71_05255 [Gemmatimonadaceae bacterium]|nr:hypothetical protein [Gemmatimonadaceae bacterium]